jgi:hypothetical protein
MNEMLPAINVPLLNINANHSRVEFRASNMLLDLEKILEEEKTNEERRIQALKGKQQFISEQVGRRLADKERKLRELEEEQKRKIYS